MRLAPLLFVLLWSSAFVAIRLGLPDVSPLLFLALRFALAAAVLGGAALLLRSDFAALRGSVAVLAVAGVLMNALYLSASYVALQAIPAATMALIGALNPMMTAVAATLFLGERLAVRQWLGLALGLAGVATAVAAGARVPSDWGAAALGLAGVASLAVGQVIHRGRCRDLPVREANTVQLAAAFCATAVLTGLFETPRAVWTPAAIGTLVFLALVVSLGAMALLMLMLRRGSAGAVASWFFLTPGVTALLGYLVLGERPSALALVGLVVSTAGVWLAQPRPRTAAAA